VKAAVVIPWREQPSRIWARNQVANWYQENLPEATIHYTDTADEYFNLAGARNLGVRNNADADVVILNDADTIPEIEPLRSAIEAAATDSAVHLPYTQYRSLRYEGTMQYANGYPLRKCNHLLVDGACSGVYVTSPETWFLHGGQDEKFRGWGFEDAAWIIAHTTLLDTEPTRHRGNVYTFHHDSAVKEGEQYEANAARCYRYQIAAGDVEKIKELVFDESS
jgi:hypothetical protein